MKHLKVGEKDTFLLGSGVIESVRVEQHVCVLLTSSLSVRYGFIKSGAFSVIPSSCDI